jgi:acyl-coenzyme A thioesterase PaaI-like protein
VLSDSLQDRYAPNSVCFGCGPKNSAGLRLKSVPSGVSLVAEFTPRKEHVAFGNFGSGGIISVLMDCHGNWAATYAMMKARGLSRPPGTVTAEYTVRFLRPSPVDVKWDLSARATKIEGDRAWVSAELKVAGALTATMSGLFVAVKESHPAFHRWQ